LTRTPAGSDASVDSDSSKRPLTSTARQGTAAAKGLAPSAAAVSEALGANVVTIDASGATLV
jgi:hypothetical protein